MSSVHFDSITRRFGGVCAVNALSFDISDHEFCVLVGPSGCGKTTALRTLAGLEMPNEGSILLGGQDVTDRPAKDRNIAMVFQNYALYPHMTVAENMSFALRIQKVPRADIDARVLRAAKLLRIEELLERRPRQLSGGQRQRVAVGRAIVRDPEVFLFDEPLSNLDAKLRASARVELRELQQRLGTTTVYVTHDQVEAMTMADKIVLMNGGEAVQIGTPMELYDDPATTFAATFLGSPPMNLIDATVIDHGEGPGLRVAGTELPIRVPQPVGSEIVFGIRPENLSIGEPSAPESMGFVARLTRSEELGSETVLHFDIDGCPLLVKSGGRPQLREGEVVPVTFNEKSIRLFDSRSERVPPWQ